MLERLGRRGRRKIIVKKHFEVVQLLLLQFFSPVSRCTRNRYFDLTKQQFIFFNFFFFLNNGWVTQSVMANMQGMRSSGSAGRARGGGSERRERRNEAAGKEGAFSPNEPGCRNICSGLVLHPRSFTREKSLPVHMGLAGACGGTFPSLRPPVAGGGARCHGERRAHVGLRGARELLKARLGPVVAEGLGPTSSEQTGDEGEPSAFSGARPTLFERSPKMGLPQTKPRAWRLLQCSQLRDVWGGRTKANPSRCLRPPG